MTPYTQSQEFVDDRDRTMFVASYRAPDGSLRTVDIWAAQWDEAEEHIEAIRETLSLDGVVYRREEQIK